MCFNLSILLWAKSVALKSNCLSLELLRGIFMSGVMFHVLNAKIFVEAIDRYFIKCATGIIASYIQVILRFFFLGNERQYKRIT